MLHVQCVVCDVDRHANLTTLVRLIFLFFAVLLVFLTAVLPRVAGTKKNPVLYQYTAESDGQTVKVCCALHMYTS